VVVRIRWQRPAPAFYYPIETIPRTAVLVPCFRSGGSIRVFRGGWGDEVRRFAPEAVAATSAQLEALTRTGIPSLRHAVIVLTHQGDGWLTEAGRERFWSAFRVPIFEQIIGHRGELLATDCEAHGGLHIESSKLPIDKKDLDASLCACGRKTPRLVSSQQTELVDRVAAYAR
jgi:hypothetical protein